MKLSKPILKAIGKPIADHNEYLPPTKSQKAKTFSLLMPNASAFCGLAETAIKCLAVALLFFACWSNQSRAAKALAKVSSVVNDLEETINKVVSGFNLLKVSCKSVGSILTISVIGLLEKPNHCC